jgi:hypothetical protein
LKETASSQRNQHGQRTNIGSIAEEEGNSGVAKAAEGIQQETLVTEDMTDVTDEMKTNSQKKAVGTKLKHNEESGTVNAQTEELTTVTHMGAVGPQICIVR